EGGVRDGELVLGGIRPQSRKVEDMIFAAAGEIEVELNDVVPGGAGDRVVARASIERIVAGTADQLVVSNAGDDQIVALLAINEIVAVRGRDRVGAGCAVYVIIDSVNAGERVRHHVDDSRTRHSIPQHRSASALRTLDARPIGRA